MMRTIKSFVLRAGRMSPRQQQGLDLWLKDYMLPTPECLWDLTKEFGREAPTYVEIGFGMGASLIEMAKVQPLVNFIGVEVHQAGIGSLAADLHEQGILNVRIAPYDAVTVFKESLSAQSLAGVQVFFPDPWPKKRHHKRRLIQPEFVHLMVEKIKIGGTMHCATDWEEYAQHMLVVLSAEGLLKNSANGCEFATRPDFRPLTKFEQRGQRLGHGVWDLIFIRQS